MGNNTPALIANEVYLFSIGDHDSFKKIYHALYHNVYYVCRKLLQNDDDAEDITQETFVKLWNLKEQFKAYSHISGFVLTTARNACLNALRNKDRASKGMLRFAESVKVAAEHEGAEDPDLIALQTMIQSITLEELTHTIAKLPKDNREALQLYFFDKLNKTEIADRFGITSTAAAKRINRGVVLLRIKLKRPVIGLILIAIINLLKKLYN